MTSRQKMWLRIMLWSLVVAGAVVIFSFSAQNSEVSAQTSSRVIRWLLIHFDRNFSALSLKEQALRIRAWSRTVRKLAHFTLFAGMGFIAFAALSVDLAPRRAFPAVLGLGTLQAVLDEVHQSFVPGRSAEFGDVCIDVAGVLLGAAVLLLLFRVVKKRKKEA